jgi:hypothetical protein
MTVWCDVVRCAWACVRVCVFGGGGVVGLPLAKAPSVGCRAALGMCRCLHQLVLFASLCTSGTPSPPPHCPVFPRSTPPPPHPTPAPHPHSSRHAPGGVCVPCPATGAACEPDQPVEADPGYWVGVGTGAVVATRCEPPAACNGSNTCAPGYTGAQVRLRCRAGHFAGSLAGVGEAARWCLSCVCVRVCVCVGGGGGQAVGGDQGSRVGGRGLGVGWGDRGRGADLAPGQSPWVLNAPEAYSPARSRLFLFSGFCSSSSHRWFVPVRRLRARAQLPRPLLPRRRLRAVPSLPRGCPVRVPAGVGGGGGGGVCGPGQWPGHGARGADGGVLAAAVCGWDGGPGVAAAVRTVFPAHPPLCPPPPASTLLLRRLRRH